jgi:hypothetical protein
MDRQMEYANVVTIPIPATTHAIRPATINFRRIRVPGRLTNQAEQQPRKPWQRNSELD